MSALHRLTGFEGLPLSWGETARFATVELARAAAKREGYPFRYVRAGELGGPGFAVTDGGLKTVAPVPLWWGLYDSRGWFRWRDMSRTRAEITQ